MGQKCFANILWLEKNTTNFSLSNFKPQTKKKRKYKLCKLIKLEIRCTLNNKIQLKLHLRSVCVPTNGGNDDDNAFYPKLLHANKILYRTVLAKFSIWVFLSWWQIVLTSTLWVHALHVNDNNNNNNKIYDIPYSMWKWNLFGERAASDIILLHLLNLIKYWTSKYFRLIIKSFTIFSRKIQMNALG